MPTTPETTQAALPPQQRRGLRAIVTSTGLSTLGDGIRIAAIPLAAAAITRDPAAVATVSAAGFAPWLLVTPAAGALVDRLPRRATLIVADVTRGLALIGLTALAFAGGLAGITGIVALAVAAAVCATGQIFADTASQALLADLAERRTDELNRVNGRISSATSAGRSLLGPPIGSTLYAWTPWAPFATDALSFVGSAGLLTAVPSTPRPQKTEQKLIAAIVEGARYLWHHRQLRALCALTAAANLSLFAALATMVLNVTSQMGVTTAGYGLLLGVGALGGVAGGLLANKIVGALGGTTTIIIGLAAQAVTWPLFAITTSPIVAGAVLVIVEACAAITTTVVITARQTSTPRELLGRVVSAFRVVGSGAAPAGAALGGAVATAWGLDAPLWTASGILVIAVALAIYVGRSTSGEERS